MSVCQLPLGAREARRVHHNVETTKTIKSEKVKMVTIYKWNGGEGAIDLLKA